ncbi:MAG: AraC family transcriptional regulator [Chloroflexota bacterium]
MKVSFQKKRGDHTLGIDFFWKFAIESKPRIPVLEHFIPELFFDFFYIKAGRVHWVDPATGKKTALRQQTLKTIHHRPLHFQFSAPLVVFGARLSLAFAESFWEGAKANTLLNQTWVKGDAKSLEDFARQVSATVRTKRHQKFPRPMLSSGVQEANWLVHYSPRHKRRMYESIFGLSRKELLNIRNMQAFLEQTCDFASGSPRIIQHVNPEVFYDQPHLNRLFKKMTGVSPVEYFETNSILQDNLISASYNENPNR